MPELGRGRTDELFGSARLGEIQFCVVNASAGDGQGASHAFEHWTDATRFSTPGLVAVVRFVMVQEQAGTKGGQPACDGVTDAGAAADAGHQSYPVAQGEHLPLELPGRDLAGSHDRRSPYRVRDSGSLACAASSVRICTDFQMPRPAVASRKFQRISSSLPQPEPAGDSLAGCYPRGLDIAVLHMLWGRRI